MASWQNDSRIVESVRVVVHTTGWLGPGTTMSDNHWSIYLVLTGCKDSVRFNMRADYGDPKGILDCSSLSYTLPKSALRHWDYQLRGNISVAHIYQLVIRYRRDEYRMSGGGSGCRFWVLTIIGDLEVNGWLSMVGATEDLLPNMLYRYSTSGEVQDLDMICGEFV
ncbi:hypothetical protein HDV62DRAFT_393470 [Trichoderma sp. SZMC 28011]